MFFSSWRHGRWVVETRGKEFNTYLLDGSIRPFERLRFFGRVRSGEMPGTAADDSDTREFYGGTEFYVGRNPESLSGYAGPFDGFSFKLSALDAEEVLPVQRNTVIAGIFTKDFDVVEREKYDFYTETAVDQGWLIGLGFARVDRNIRFAGESLSESRHIYTLSPDLWVDVMRDDDGKLTTRKINLHLSFEDEIDTEFSRTRSFFRSAFVGKLRYVDSSDLHVDLGYRRAWWDVDGRSKVLPRYIFGIGTPLWEGASLDLNLVTGDDPGTAADDSKYQEATAVFTFSF